MKGYILIVNYKINIYVIDTHRQLGIYLDYLDATAVAITVGDVDGSGGS